MYLMQGQLECDSDTVFELAAYVLQAVHGDFVEYVFLSSSYIILLYCLIWALLLLPGACLILMILTVIMTKITTFLK